MRRVAVFTSATVLGAVATFLASPAAVLGVTFMN